MPIISLFFGIIIRMYHDDHPPPHFHASYQGFEAFVAIATGEIIAGSLPKGCAACAAMSAGPQSRTHGKLATQRSVAADGDGPRSRS
jgi:hypothetical protein